MDQVVKVNVYCSNSGYFDTINEEYRKFFPKDPPARTFVTVGSWRGNSISRWNAPRSATTDSRRRLKMATLLP